MAQIANEISCFRLLQPGELQQELRFFCHLCSRRYSQPPQQRKSDSRTSTGQEYRLLFEVRYISNNNVVLSFTSSHCENVPSCYLLQNLLILIINWLGCKLLHLLSGRGINRKWQREETSRGKSKESFELLNVWKVEQQFPFLIIFQLYLIRFHLAVFFLSIKKSIKGDET